MRLCGEQRQGQDQGSCPVSLPPETARREMVSWSLGKAIWEQGPREEGAGALRPRFTREARGRVSLGRLRKAGVGL